METVQHNKVRIIPFFLTLAALIAVSYFGFRTYELSHQKIALTGELTALKEEYASTTRSFEDQVNILERDLMDERGGRVAAQIDLATEKDKVGTLQGQVEVLSGTVGALEKLSRTDAELLKKYSKVYFLNENYIPAQLTSIEKNFIFDQKKDLKIHGNVWPYLKALMTAAGNNALDMRIISAFRSFGEQAGLKSTYSVTYGAGTANSFSADQGYSEHQLGTTVDFTTPALGNNFSSFDKTPAFTWLTQNAYTYGFVLSYPKNNSFYVYEPWHWRFVGRDLAKKLHDDGTTFYEVDQRVINTFLASIFN